MYGRITPFKSIKLLSAGKTFPSCEASNTKGGDPEMMSNYIWCTHLISLLYILLTLDLRKEAKMAATASCAMANSQSEEARDEL